MNENLYNDYREAYDEAVNAIVRLREAAEELKNNLEEIIESCENIENQF